MTNKMWGYINCPNDALTILEYLGTQKEKKQFVLCELGVAMGQTGNRMMEFLKQLGIKKLQYFGIDNKNLDDYGFKQTVDFEYEEMKFIQGNREQLSGLPKFDFGFVDACHCAECVYHDAIAMSKKIKKGGAMAFHDTSLLWQYPNDESKTEKYWQHYVNGKPIRPMGVVEGIMMSRAKWNGEWELLVQTGDNLAWGGIRIYQKM